MRGGLYVDATDLIRTSGNIPTGIPRVHAFLARQACADPDPAVQTIVFDRRIAGYRHPTEDETRLLSRTFDPSQNLAAGENRFHDIFERIRENPSLDREFDRNFAARIAGTNHGAGLRYAVVKTLIRAYRISQRAKRGISRAVVPLRGEVDTTAGIILFADALDAIGPFSVGMRPARGWAFVCHDLIPWLRPEFVSRRQKDRLILQLKALLQSGALPVCASDASRRMLEGFIRDAGLPPTQIQRFPMPSALYEKARALGRTSRFTPDEPFVLYCSTVDPRKNHLLLLKIWKQAHDEGVGLPKLVCAGKWGGAAREVRGYLAAHSYLTGRVEFVGPIDDSELIDLYRSAVFGVMPSHIEGWGLGASECLDFGLPVIVSNIPALQEAVRGLMPAIDADDQAGWFTKIRELSESAAAHEALRKKISDNYRPVAAETSWDVIKAAVVPPPDSQPLSGDRC